MVMIDINNNAEKFDSRINQKFLRQQKYTANWKFSSHGAN